MHAVFSLKSFRDLNFNSRQVIDKNGDFIGRPPCLCHYQCRIPQLDDYENNIDWNDEDFSCTETFPITEMMTSDKKKSADLTPCVVVDIIEGEIKRCNSTDKLRPLYNMIGICDRK